MLIHILIKKRTEDLIIEEIIMRSKIICANRKRIDDLGIISGETDLSSLDLRERLAPYWEVEAVIRDGVKNGRIL